MISSDITNEKWSIINKTSISRECDISFFKYRGIAIPFELKDFFGLELLKSEKRKELNILYEGNVYDAHFIVDQNDRARMFWESSLGNILSDYCNVDPFPHALFQKQTDTIWSLNILVGSEYSLYSNRTEWIIPCNNKVYNCFEAFNDLIKVDWRQNRQLSKVAVNDIVFIYSSDPISAITFQCIVNKVGVPALEIQDLKYYADPKAASLYGPFIELQCIRAFDSIDGLKLESLRQHGVKGNIQGPMRVSDELSKHLNEMVKIQNSFDWFGGNEQYIEAMHTRTITTPEDEKTAKTLSYDALKRIAQHRSSNTTEIRNTISKQYQRDPYIKEFALRRANGKCQLCGNPAPFNDKNGKPYLESHHIIWLSNGGADSIENTVALCPNCHRKMHIVSDSRDIALLQKGIDHSK